MGAALTRGVLVDTPGSDPVWLGWVGIGLGPSLQNPLNQQPWVLEPGSESSPESRCFKAQYQRLPWALKVLMGAQVLPGQSAVQ